MSASVIRLATLEDAERILEIYNPYVINTCITFEYEPLTLPAFKERMMAIMERSPFLVYEQEGVIVGYAYTSASNPRAAYSWDCDSSIYLDPSYHGKGIGRALYKTLFLLMEELGYYNVYALVTSPNPVSLAFHQNLGFEMEGHHAKIGYKFGKWLGVSRLVKRIGDFEETPMPVRDYRNMDLQPILEAYLPQTAN